MPRFVQAGLPLVITEGFRCLDVLVGSGEALMRCGHGGGFCRRMPVSVAACYLWVYMNEMLQSSGDEVTIPSLCFSMNS